MPQPDHVRRKWFQDRGLTETGQIPGHVSRREIDSAGSTPALGSDPRKRTWAGRTGLEADVRDHRELTADLGICDGRVGSLKLSACCLRMTRGPRFGPEQEDLASLSAGAKVVALLPIQII